MQTRNPLPRPRPRPRPRLTIDRSLPPACCCHQTRAGVLAGALALWGACDAAGPSELADPAAVASTRSAQCACLNPTLDLGRSLLVTDATALAPFTLQAVLDQLRATAAATGQSSQQLYVQWWDLNNDAAHAQTRGAHCDDVKDSAGRATVNGFPVECPRQEGVLAATNPFVPGSPDSYVPLALVNRFDLAKSDGSDCGEYRVVFGKKSGQDTGILPGTDRNLIIFEGVLPNPSPSAGAAGCAPVARFWAALSNDPSALSRAGKLQQLYFGGITEPCSGAQLEPVLHHTHFAGNGHGQIRTNQFMNGRDYFGQGALGQPWELREYSLVQACPSPTACTLSVRMDAVKVNPYGPQLAMATGTSSLTAMQQDFVNNQVAALIAGDVNLIGMHTPGAYNAGESKSQTTENDYLAQGGGNSPLTSAIQSKLLSLGSALTPSNVLDRATTQSCGGCHQLSSRKALGGGLLWPASNGFTHIDEQGNLSPALTRQFLPHRADVLSAYLAGRCAGTATPPSPSGAGTLGGASTH